MSLQEFFLTTIMWFGISFTSLQMAKIVLYKTFMKTKIIFPKHEELPELYFRVRRAPHEPKDPWWNKIFQRKRWIIVIRGSYNRMDNKISVYLPAYGDSYGIYPDEWIIKEVSDTITHEFLHFVFDNQVNTKITDGQQEAMMVRLGY